MEKNIITEKYMMLFDHHTHTTYSHGKGSILDNVRVAYEKGLRSIAITDHGPGNISYGMDMTKICAMREDIRIAKNKYPGIEVLLGVEANTLRKTPFIDISSEQCKELDIILAGYHYAVLGSGMIPNRLGIRTRDILIKNTEMITNALYHNEEKGNHIEILTHPGDKAPFDMFEISKACEKTGTLMEINGKHPHLDIEEIKIASKFDVKFVISSDAHMPEKVGQFEKQLQRAMEAGLDIERIVNISIR